MCINNITIHVCYPIKTIQLQRGMIKIREFSEIREKLSSLRNAWICQYEQKYKYVFDLMSKIDLFGGMEISVFNVEFDIDIESHKGDPFFELKTSRIRLMINNPIISLFSVNGLFTDYCGEFEMYFNKNNIQYYFDKALDREYTEAFNNSFLKTAIIESKIFEEYNVETEFPASEILTDYVLMIKN